MRTLALLPLALLAAACTTPQERAARAQSEMEQMMMVYGPACSRLGYPVNSDQWRSCILNLATRDDLQRYSGPSYYGGWGAGRWRGGFWGPYW